MVVERILIDIKPRRGETVNQSAIRIFRPSGLIDIHFSQLFFMLYPLTPKGCDGCRKNFDRDQTPEG